MTNNSQKNPFANLILDEEEMQLEAALEKGEFEEAPDFDNTKNMLESAARRHRQLSTSRPVTLRINQLDLVKIKAKAKRNNIAYQTLLGLAIHDFAEDKRKVTI